MTDPAPIDDDFNPDERALCPDDSCIGVLDSSGKCKVCGQVGAPAAAEERTAASSPELNSTPDSPDNAAPADPSPAVAIPEDPAAAIANDSDDFADRRLCTDPGCIGVLDAAGRCKECGRNADDPS